VTMIGRALKLVALSSLSSLALLACGGATPTPAPVEPVAETPAPTPEPEPPPPAAEEKPAEPPPPAADAPPAGRAPSGRPPLFFSNPSKITEQVGETPAAKFELGGVDGASLRIPEYALRSGVLVTFQIDKKAKRHKGAAGETYRVQAQVPPSADFSTVESNGPMFEIKLPKAGAAANLAVGEEKIEKDKPTLTWKVVAPKKSDDKSATFEISGFTNTILHMTSEAPGG
jgi:hypothetical protein